MAQLLRRYARRRAGAVLGLGLAVAGLSVVAIDAHPRISTNVTWQADIQPLFARQCDSCHAREGDAVKLSTFAEARPWSRAIREEVLERRMPPPRGRPGVDAGVDDHPLSPMERDLIVAWIDGGMPEGRASAAGRDSRGKTAAERSPAEAGAAATATFWCRMHPEVRADRAGVCPLCGMPLSAFTPDLTRRYGWSFTREPGGRHAFEISEETTGTRLGAGDLEVLHEHPLHLFIVSEDFRTFEHVHPTAAAHTWTTAWRPRAAGAYRLFADFLPIGGPPQMLQRRLMIQHPVPAATAAAATPAAAAVADRLVSTSHGLQATLTAPTLRAGDTHRLTITLHDAASDRAVTDLDPYLGAWGHLFVLHESRDEALHAHPDSGSTTPRGPTIAFDVLLPRAGVYHLWMQVQRHNAIITLPFVLHAGPRA